MTPLWFVLALFAGLCVAHVIGRLLPHKSGPQAGRIQRAVEPRRVQAEESYANLFGLGDETFTGWKVQRYTNEEYKQMRAKR